MKHFILLLVFLIGHLFAFPQEASISKSFIIDIESEKWRDSVFNDFIDSMPDLRQRKEQFMPFNIYEFGTHYLTFVGMDEGIIDATLFSKDYFISGRFILDFYDKTQSNDSTDAYISFGRSYVYDTVNRITSRFKVSDWTDRSYYDECDKKVGRDINRKPSKYLNHVYDPFEDYIGYLLYYEIIDFVFSFPTRLDYDEELILSSIDTYFAIKDKKIFVISRNWTPENRGKNPLLYSIEDYLDCCWDQMTNVTKK